MESLVDRRHGIGEVWTDDEGYCMSKFDDNPIHKLRILHIEASDMDALLVLRSLEGLASDLHVERATSADAVCRLNACEEWDVILADPYTPNLSIPELLDQSRHVCPVLLVAGPVPAGDVLSWGRLGLVDIIAKQHTNASRKLLRAAVRRAVTCRTSYLALQAHGAETSNNENLPLISSQQRSQRTDIGHQAAQRQQTPHLFLQG